MTPMARDGSVPGPQMQEKLAALKADLDAQAVVLPPPAPLAADQAPGPDVELKSMQASPSPKHQIPNPNGLSVHMYTYIYIPDVKPEGMQASAWQRAASARACGHTTRLRQDRAIVALAKAAPESFAAMAIALRASYNDASRFMFS